MGAPELEVWTRVSCQSGGVVDHTDGLVLGNNWIPAAKAFYVWENLTSAYILLELLNTIALFSSSAPGVGNEKNDF